MKKIYCFITLLLLVGIATAQIQSPSQFLGYPLGTRYTPHHRIVDYFQYVAKEESAMVHLQQYGKTNEHRPLLVAFVSSADNISRLEDIRKNNLNLAHIGNSQGSIDENTPAIVWLSYNVHGNETSSSEAAIKTLFALVDPSETRTKEWIKNTVVVIDPCLNPDGRERYINWYSTMNGNTYNPLLISREHHENWPGGRSNHYNFDLNRDWVWQTQVESRQRVALYNQWLPQIHVDFHEQGINAPYYFAPAAEPFHEVITPWQRDFQKTIGKNHAKYFDKQGWLYFTKVLFDLFYPSYGDTYPLYNGAIGMTYEQAGGGAGGLGVLTNEKDTLTLSDRILHHYTTGLSTIEIASKNAGKLMKEFQKYFDDAVNARVGKYKTYVIKYKPQDAQRIDALKVLLDRNTITYGTASGSAEGFHYGNGKEEAFPISKEDLVISGVQPKAALVQVLFEPQSKLSDSVTYDITAWALPYAYGLDAYATKEVLKPMQTGSINEIVNNIPADAYGCVIPWAGLASVRVVGAFLDKDIRILFSEVPFEEGGNQFDPGAVIITKNGNARFGSNLWKLVNEAANKESVKVYELNTGMVDKGADFGSRYIHTLRPVKVAMLTGEGINPYGAGEVWNFFDNEIKYPITLINAEDFERIALPEFDVLILPDGRYSFLKDEKSAEGLKDWIQNGGKLIALENAVSQLSALKWSVLKKVNESKDSAVAKGKMDEKEDIYKALKLYKDRERDALTEHTPGAIYKVEVDNSHPLMFGYPDYYYTLKMSPDVYEYIQDGGWNVGYLKKQNYVTGYVGHKLTDKLKDGLLFGVQDLGRGAIIYLTDDVLFRNFWQTGKLMLCNAVFLVGE